MAFEIKQLFSFFIKIRKLHILRKCGKRAVTLFFHTEIDDQIRFF